MTDPIPQARSRRELRELEAAALKAQSRRTAKANPPREDHVATAAEVSPVGTDVFDFANLTQHTVAQPTTRDRAAARGAASAGRSKRGMAKAAKRAAAAKNMAPARRINSGPAPSSGGVAAKTAKVGGKRRKLASKLMSVGSMAGVGLMLVATSLPANAFYTEPSTTTLAADVIEGQALSVETAAAAPVVQRDTYTASSLKEQIRALYGNRTFSYSVNPTGSIRWPFPIAVPISSGFGPRVSCGYCSSDHKGVDFTPGTGTPIQAIADGIVVHVGTIRYGLGHNVRVAHNINGQRVESIYGHMQAGSIAVLEGQQVQVGDVLGKVGSTGASTGAHLHLEIHINGVAVDPYNWLKANAN